MGSVIKVNDVSMMFNLSSEKIDSIKEYFIKAVRRELHFQEFWALRDISFTLEKGDSLGIVGLNGSGKSTLLKIVSGILKPTKGTVETYGSIAPSSSSARALTPTFPRARTSISTARSSATAARICPSGSTRSSSLPNCRTLWTLP